MELFDALPICCTVCGSLDGDFFCVHGGISPEIETLDEIDDLDRFGEPPSSGPIWY